MRHRSAARADKHDDDGKHYDNAACAASSGARPAGHHNCHDDRSGSVSHIEQAILACCVGACFDGWSGVS